MKPLYLQLGMSCLVCSFVGCAMCCGPHDYDYPTIGGKHQRTDQTYGRVGSIFSDPMASPMGGSADSNLKAPKPRTRGDASEEGTDEAEKLRDKIKQELEEKKSNGLEKEPLEVKDRAVPLTKEALRHIPRPRAFSEWR